MNRDINTNSSKQMIEFYKKEVKRLTIENKELHKAYATSHEIIKDLYKKNRLLEKIKQIKPRTIETLEIGDCVHIKDRYGKFDGIVGELSKINNQIITIYSTNEGHVYTSDIENIQIIPHEFLSLWSDFHD